MKKILFVQLPPPRFIFEDPGANIPLASGFLASCVKTLAGEDFETEILSGDVVDVFADLGIIQEILQRSPDILALSLYLWNSQRSLFVASAVKRLNSNIRVMVGGPEVTPDNTWVLTHPAVDLGVFGEGERQLLEVLKTIIYTDKKRRSLEALFHPGSKLFKSKKTSLKPWDLKHSKYPYVDGTLGVSKSGCIFLETVRGCPFQCKYCYYHKAFGSVRAYPLSIVEKLLDFAYAPEAGVNEIYLMDPTFNARPGFRDMLKIVARKRRKKDIKIHTELRADLLREGDVQLFKEAGLVSAEIGLQTINTEVLNLAGRSGDPESVLKGADELKKAGVDVTTGIILGLPGDSPEGFSKTLERLKVTQSFSVIQPFTLSVLPGTDFRREANVLGIKYDDRPPYHIKSSETFSPDSMRDCLKKFERTFDMELDYFGFPSLVDSGRVVKMSTRDIGYVSKWIIRLPSDSALSKIDSVSRLATNPFTIWFKGSDSARFEKTMIEIVSNFANHNPHSVFSLVFEFDSVIPRKLMRQILDATGNPGMYFNKAFFPLYKNGDVISPNFIVIVPFIETAYARNKILKHYSTFSTVVWSIDISKIFLTDKTISPVLVSGTISMAPSIKAKFGRELMDKMSPRPEEILFRKSENQEWWNYQIIGLFEQSRFDEKILLTK